MLKLAAQLGNRERNFIWLNWKALWPRRINKLKSPVGRGQNSRKKKMYSYYSSFIEVKKQKTKAF